MFSVIQNEGVILSEAKDLAPASRSYLGKILRLRLRMTTA